MAERVDLKDLIVILPGILGSVLQKDGRDLWGISAQSLWDILRTGANNLDALKLLADDANAESLDDGIRATRLVEDVTIVPGFFKVDGYSRLSKKIEDSFSNIIKGDIYNDPDERAANLYHFPYDWRRDNRINAKILQRLLDKRLECWRESSGNRHAKVILLAHSMGGLISRYYLEVLGGWTDCKALFTFGTPYRGSLRAIDVLANGIKIGPIDVDGLFKLKAAIPTFTSIYQLLPRYKALKIGNDYYRIAESPVDLPNIDRVKAIDALNFHNEIDDAADTNLTNSIYRSSFVTCPIVGAIQPTLQSAELVNGKIIASETLPTWLQNRPNLSDGDGTVPQVSATPVQMKDVDILAIADYIAESHGALQNQPDTLLNILKKIESTQVANLEDVRGGIEAVAPRSARGLKGIGLSLDDLYLTDEPIVMRAKVTAGTDFTSLTAEIDCVSEDRPPIFQNFTLENDTWVMATDNLAAGIYRVKVQTDNTNEDAPNPVHNSFVVT